MATDSDTAKTNYANLVYCRDNGHVEWLARADKCINYRNNLQWDPADLARLRREKRPALTFNVVESLITTMRGMQRAMRNDVRFAPVADADNDTSQVQDAVWLHVQNTNDFDFLETEVWERGLVTGRGYYDVRVEFDHNMKGGVKIRGRRSQDVVLDPCVEQYDPETWPQVFVAPWVNLVEIEQLFGKEKAEALRSRGVPGWYNYEDDLLGSALARVPFYTYGWNLDVERELVRALRLIERQYTVLKMKDLFIDVETGDTSEIPENWDRARVQQVLQQTSGLSTVRRKVKTIRWVTTCEDVVLHEADSPFDWFSIVPFFPKPYDGYTLSPVETLLDAQDMYNKVTSQELHIINTIANSGIITKVGNVRNYTPAELEQNLSKSGLILEVENVADTIKIQPNNIPQGHDRISQKADQIMRSLSGISNQSRGFAREDVASEAILANQAASDVNFADMLSKLHRSKRMVAERCQDAWQKFYTETRVLMINRGSTFRPEFAQMALNQPTPEGTVLNDITRGEYTTVLIPAPSRTSMTESEFEQLLELKKLGLQIPDQLLIEMSNIPNKGQFIQQMQGDSAQQQQAQQQMQEQMHQLQVQLAQAKAEREHAAAQLNLARAEKAHNEAQTDPDASYERVETQRIATDAQIARERTAAEVHKAELNAGLQRRRDDHKTALGLTQVQADQHKDTMHAMHAMHRLRIGHMHAMQAQRDAQAHDARMQPPMPPPQEPAEAEQNPPTDGAQP